MGLGITVKVARTVACGDTRRVEIARSVASAARMTRMTKHMKDNALTGAKSVHLIGIGGIGVSGVARALIALGFDVSGSDVRESQLTKAIRALGATVHIGHNAKYIEGVDVVVHSTAIPETNTELVAARAGNGKLVHRAEVLGAILDLHEVAVGVVGTHGKGTVSSAITWMMEAAGMEPGFIIGGLLENFSPPINARVSSRRHLIVAEVDESDGSLKWVHPTHLVINNLEADHLNYYDSLEHIQETVIAALAANTRLTHVALNGDDPGARALEEQIRALGVTVTLFGREATDLDVRAVPTGLSATGGTFDLVAGGEQLGGVSLVVPGLYNVDNATGAAACALSLSVPFEAIAKALSSFAGLENRFTVVDVGERRIIKDYISHPTGIRRVLEAASEDGRPIWAVFKPYRFTMINYLQDDYAEAFHQAHHTVITELYTAGEVPIAGIDTEFLCNKIRSRGPEVTFVQDIGAITDWLGREVPASAQVIFFGGDDLFEVADSYAGTLRA